MRTRAPRWGGSSIWGTVPRKGKVAKIAEAHGRAEIDWRRARNAPLDGQPDYERAGEIEAEREELYEEAGTVRLEVLALPARSPRGLLIKLAIAMEAKAIGEIEERLANAGWHGVHDGWVSEDLLPVLAADLRAMVGRAQA